MSVPDNTRKAVNAILKYNGTEAVIEAIADYCRDQAKKAKARNEHFSVEDSWLNLGWRLDSVVTWIRDNQ